MKQLNALKLSLFAGAFVLTTPLSAGSSNVGGERSVISNSKEVLSYSIDGENSIVVEKEMYVEMYAEAGYRPIHRMRGSIDEAMKYSFENKEVKSFVQFGTSLYLFYKEEPWYGSSQWGTGFKVIERKTAGNAE